MRKYTLLAATALIGISTEAVAQDQASTAPPPAATMDTTTGTSAESSGGGRLEEITVTAQRRAENLQQVPIAITAIDGESLQNAGVVSLSDLKNVVSGLNFQTSGLLLFPRVRGVGTQFSGAGVENPVALYIDDVYYGSQLSAPSDMIDVQQAAVLKGPQGTLFGRNATGGVIQLTTFQPLADFGGFLDSELDQYLTSRNAGYVTTGLGDTLKTNLAVRYTTQGEGWGKNLLSGKDTNRIKSDFAIRNKWEWTPTDGTRVLISADYSRRNVIASSYRYPVGGQPDGIATVLPGLGATVFSDNPFDIASPIDSNLRLTAGGGSVAIKQELGSLNLTSITAYRKFKYQSATDTGGSTVSLFDVSLKQSGNQFSQELQLGKTDHEGLSWLLGAYFYKAVDYVDQMDLNFYDASPFVLDPNNPSAVQNTNLAFYGGTENTFRYFNELHTKSYALFGQATLAVGEDTRVTAGLRYTHDSRSIDGFSTVFYEGDDSVQSIETQGGQSFKEGKLTWRAAVDHDLTPDVMVYGSYNRGFKSGGYNAQEQSLLPAYKSEIVDTFEIGLKSELFDRRVRFNPAIFYSKYKNVQVQVVDLYSTLSANAPKAELYGIDLDLEWRATEHLSFKGGLEWMHTEFLDFPRMPYAVPDANGVLVSGAVPINGAGNGFPFAPEFSANIGANYTMEVAGAKVDFNIVDSYNGGFFFQADNNYKQDSFHLLNSSLTWTSPDGRVSAGIFGRNLLNELISSTTAAVTPVGYLSMYTTPPRTYGFNLRYRFGAQ